MWCRKSGKSVSQLFQHKKQRFASVSRHTKRIIKATDTLQLGHTRKPNIGIPALGFGTAPGGSQKPPDVVAKAAHYALAVGYRHLDCARDYANEKEIGEVIQDYFNHGRITREQLWVTSKLFNHEHAPPDGAPWRALQDTLKNLQLDYLDCFLIHWPFRNSIHHPPLPFDVEQWAYTFKCLNELVAQGYIRSIGVANATVTKMEGLLEMCRLWNIRYPSILSVELHPYLQQPKLVDFCRKNDIMLSAAMPLGSPKSIREDDPIILDNPVFSEIAQECNASITQVILRWHLDKGFVVTPGATETWMIEENYHALNITLTEAQTKRIDAEDRHFRYERAEMFRWIEDQPWTELFDNE